MRYSSSDSSGSRHPKYNSNPFFTLVLLLLLLVIGYKLFSSHTYHKAVMQREQTLNAQQMDLESEPAPVEEQQWLHYSVHNGDSIAKIFSRANLDPSDLHDILKLGVPVADLKKLKSGQSIDLLVSNSPDPDSKYKLFNTLKLQITPQKTLVVTFDGAKYASEIVSQPITTKIHFVTVNISNSFFAAGNKAGVPSAVLNQLTKLFGARIDFQKDLRPGDYFTVEYEDEYLDNKLLRSGDVVAAEFMNRGTHYYAIRFEDNNGNEQYYTANGSSVLKAFLRRPINGGRISSPFSMHRMQPILGYVRPHTGTDFAAPYGTPIHATADGRILFIGRKGGYGRAIMIDHGSHIVTLYGHMSRFATGMTTGKAVKQGQVIGYIGTSGLATGPHVHYEVRINGKFYNPMTVKLPDAQPIPRADRSRFMVLANQEMAALTNYRLNTLGGSIPAPTSAPTPAPAPTK